MGSETRAGGLLEATRAPLVGRERFRQAEVSKNRVVALLLIVEVFTVAIHPPFFTVDHYDVGSLRNASATHAHPRVRWRNGKSP